VPPGAIVLRAALFPLKAIVLSPRLMSRILRTLLVVSSAGILSGCGAGIQSQSAPEPAHGGNMIALPSGRGFVELLTASESTAAVRKGAPVKSRIVAYFYNSDGTTELSPAPTDVKVKIGTAEKGTLVSLAPEAKAGGKYASEPGDFPDGFQGRLEANVNGEAVQAAFKLR
jgi:hypothetical protein